MSKKKWIICSKCKNLSKCKAGQNKMQNADMNSNIYSDIGCYELEQYYLLIDGKH